MRPFRPPPAVSVLVWVFIRRAVRRVFVGFGLVRTTSHPRTCVVCVILDLEWGHPS